MKDELKVIACLAILLLALEAGARLFETSLSKDVEHLRELPRQAALLQSAPQDTLKVLVLGNSLARCGIDLPLLTVGLRQQYHREVVIAEMHPDGTRIEEWAYGYRRYFADTGAAPELVLLVTGRLHLTDAAKSLDRMGAFYVGHKDLWEFVTRRLPGIEEGAQFFGGRYSALLTHRDRIEPLVFYNAVPGYADAAQVINQGVPEEAPGTSAADHHATCHVFADFVRRLHPAGTRLIIAQAPLPRPYMLPDVVTETARDEAVSIFTLAPDRQIPAERFPDHYHLDREGSVMFTNHLLEFLSQLSDHP